MRPDSLAHRRTRVPRPAASCRAAAAMACCLLLSACASGPRVATPTESPRVVERDLSGSAVPASAARRP